MNNQPNFNVLLDPKCNWALKHLEYFPVEVNQADYFTLLRVPGDWLQVSGAYCKSKENGQPFLEDLKKMGVVLKMSAIFSNL